VKLIHKSQSMDQLWILSKSNNPSSSVRCMALPHKLSHCQFLKKDSPP
jgi:hypothetical protein